MSPLHGLACGLALLHGLALAQPAPAPASAPSPAPAATLPDAGHAHPGSHLHEGPATGGASRPWAASPSAQPIRQDVLWLSDQPPARGRPGAHNGDSRSGHGSMMEAMGDGRKPPVRRLWLQQGSSPARASAVQASGPVLLLDPDLQTTTVQPTANDDAQAPYAVAFETATPGYYNAAYVRRSTTPQGVHLVQVAKTVLARPAGHGTRGNEVTPQRRTDERLPLEIVREPVPDEALNTRLTYGDALVYQVLRQGQPLAGAQVTVITGQGWRNSQTTDEDGKARFTLIRDYFPTDWLDFDRAHREPLLTTATWQLEEAGQHEGQAYTQVRYVASLSEAYAPSVRDYKSYAWGLGVSLGVVVLSGSAIYLYRRRRLKPYREEVFRD